MSNSIERQLSNITTAKRSCGNIISKEFHFSKDFLHFLSLFQHEMIHAYLFVTHNNRVSDESSRNIVLIGSINRIAMVTGQNF